MSMRLFVGNLAYQTTDEDLMELFSQAGNVKSARVVTYPDSGKSRGFGFVEMSSTQEGEDAIDRFNGVEIHGRNLLVNEAKPRELSNRVLVDGGRFDRDKRPGRARPGRY